MTVDLRNPDKGKLDTDEKSLAAYFKELEQTDHVKISSERLTEFAPVLFDENIVQKIEAAASARGLKDAQMMARICPTAMIFVPSIKGISHNPKEYTPDEDCVAGANVFLDVVIEMAGVQ